MITEAEGFKTNKNPDYSGSAKNLNNATEVKETLDKYIELQAIADDVKQRLEDSPLYNEWKAACEIAAIARAAVNGAIELHGSYQDIETGHYAVKQAVHSKQYHSEPFLERYGKFAQVVIQQTINQDALKGLVKGKLIDEESLKADGVITTTESYKYIVK